eukprot:scaffold14024_cov45-Phaeocystis_antarctica.AAC.1
MALVQVTLTLTLTPTLTLSLSLSLSLTLTPTPNRAGPRRADLVGLPLPRGPRAAPAGAHGHRLEVSQPVTTTHA